MKLGVLFFLGSTENCNTDCLTIQPQDVGKKKGGNPIYSEVYSKLVNDLGGEVVPIARVARYLHRDYQTLLGIYDFPVDRQKGRWMVKVNKLAKWLTK